MRRVLSCAAAIAITSVVSTPQPRVDAQGPPVERINLAERLAAGTLRPVNRQLSRVADRADGVRLSAAPGMGVTWIEGTDFALGTIEIEVRGKDVLQQSFVGLAFHRRDDDEYEAVYLRPFNFRAQDPVRHQHAVQYVSLPEFDWPLLRKQFPEEFENPVEPSVSPTDWVPVRVVVGAKDMQIFVGTGAKPTLEVRKLGRLARGAVGLWVGNTSDGDFSNVRLTHAK
jgi:hypothetical protein